MLRGTDLAALGAVTLFVAPTRGVRAADRRVRAGAGGRRRELRSLETRLDLLPTRIAVDSG
jgi:hypothetical protein